MIRDKFLPLLQQKYPNERVLVSPASGPIVVFPAKHSDVGELEIWDDGDEATISIGEITHGHFNPYKPELNQDEIDTEVTEMVLDFLEDMFADRILLWKARKGGSGGWQQLDFTEPLMEQSKDADYYVWSGPYGQVMPNNGR